METPTTLENQPDDYEMEAEYDLSKFRSRPNRYVKQINVDVDEPATSEKGQINPKRPEDQQESLGKNDPLAP